MMSMSTDRWSAYLRPKIPELSSAIKREMRSGTAAKNLMCVVSDGSTMPVMAHVGPRSIVGKLIEDFAKVLIEECPEIGKPLHEHLDHPRDDQVLVLGFFEGKIAFALLPIEHTSMTTNQRGQA